MRKVLYIPIIHSQADMGSFGTKLSLEGEKKYGRAAWQTHIEQVQISWNEIENQIKQELNITLAEKIRIYQDGLPKTGEIGLKIVKEVAKQGSRNYQILEDLLKQGAQLEEGESKELLLQEYAYISKISKATTPIEQLKAYLEYQEIAQELLNKRDAYIANRINITLKKKEVGIAFFGGKHSIIDKLDDNIIITIIQKFKDKISADLMRANMKLSLFLSK